MTELINRELMQNSYGWSTTRYFGSGGSHTVRFVRPDMTCDEYIAAFGELCKLEKCYREDDFFAEFGVPIEDADRLGVESYVGFDPGRSVPRQPAHAGYVKVEYWCQFLAQASKAGFGGMLVNDAGNALQKQREAVTA